MSHEEHSHCLESFLAQSVIDDQLNDSSLSLIVKVFIKSCSHIGRPFIHDAQVLNNLTGLQSHTECLLTIVVRDNEASFAKDRRKKNILIE